MIVWNVLRSEIVGQSDTVDEWAWREIGQYTSENTYLYGPNVAEEIGKKYGAGEYLLLAGEGRYTRITVGSRQEFYEVEAEDTAEAIMAREG